MTRYFFHSFNGQVACDDEGMDLAGDAQAITRAMYEARVLASESILTRGTLPLAERIEVVDADGRKVATVSVRDAVAIEG